MMQKMIEKIKMAYAKEQENNDIPTTAANLPRCYEDINSVWLTNVLCREIEGAAVLSFELGPIDSGTTNRRKIKITYNAAGQSARLPEKVFCKATHDLLNRIVCAICGAISNEIGFYTKIRRHVDIETPACYYTRYDHDSFNSLVILEDLSEKVEAFPTHETYINEAKAKSQMRLLAKLHAKFHEQNEDYPNALQVITQSMQTWPELFHKLPGLMEGANQGFLEAKEAIPPSLYARHKEIWPATITSVEEHNVLPKTVVHSDVHLKNWYVLPNDQMGLSDWQCCGIGHWGRDLAYTIATSLTVEDRRVWEKELVAYYVTQLQANGLIGVTFNEAWEHYRKQLISALAWWTITMHPSEAMPDILQPRDITLEFIRRLSTAMEDLGTLDLLR